MSDKAVQPAPVKPTATLADLEKIDIRVGTILKIEDVSGSDKLVRLIVDFGDHQRNILAGMKQERADPQSIKGQQALFVVNLEPRKIMVPLCACACHRIQASVSSERDFKIVTLTSGRAASICF